MKLKIVLLSFAFAFAPLALASLIPEDQPSFPLHQAESLSHRSWLGLMEMRLP